MFVKNARTLLSYLSDWSVLEELKSEETLSSSGSSSSQPPPGTPRLRSEKGGLQFTFIIYELKCNQKRLQKSQR